MEKNGKTLAGDRTGVGGASGRNGISITVCAIMLIVLAIVGITGIVRTPIGATPDVWEHLYRVSAILNGDVVARPVTATSIYHGIAAENVGGCVDADLARLSVTYASEFDLGSVDPASVPDWSRPCVDVAFNNTAVYPPTAYLPQLVGLALAGWFGLDAVGTYRAAQVATLVVFLICSGVALLIMARSGRRGYHRLASLIPCAVLFAGVLCAVLLTGASIAISADSFTFALIVLFSACLWRAFDPRLRVSAMSMISLALLGGLIAVSKIAYAPMLAMLWVVCLARRHAMPRAVRVLGMAAVPIGWTSLLIWMRIGVSGYATSPTHVSSAMVAERTARAFAHPWEPMGDILWSVFHVQTHSSWDRPRLIIWWTIMTVLAVSLVTAYVVSKRSAAGRTRCFDSGLRPSLSMTTEPLCEQAETPSVMLSGAKRSRNISSLWSWAVCWFLVLSSALLGYLALWLQYTPDGSTGVLGVQTRYFWLMLPLMALVGLGAVDAIAAERPIRCGCARSAIGKSS